MEIVQIKKADFNDNSINEMIDLAINEQDKQGVIILVLKQDGGHRIFSSNMNMFEKSFLTQSLNSFVNSWFNREG